MSKKGNARMPLNPKSRPKKYLDINVFEMAKQRIRDLYKEFDKMVVSCSFGKDSTVVLELTIQIARELGRLPVQVNFFDEELLTHHTPDFVDRTLKRKEEIDLRWYCLPIKHRNACSNNNPYWYP